MPIFREILREHVIYGSTKETRETPTIRELLNRYILGRGRSYSRIDRGSYWTNLSHCVGLTSTAQRVASIYRIADSDNGMRLKYLMVRINSLRYRNCCQTAIHSFNRKFLLASRLQTIGNRSPSERGHSRANFGYLRLRRKLTFGGIGLQLRMLGSWEFSERVAYICFSSSSPQPIRARSDPSLH